MSSSMDFERPWERAERDKFANEAGLKKLKRDMKDKLNASRLKGRSGWQDKDNCSQEHLSQLLREHVEKGDPVDVANFCMMLHYRGEGILPSATTSKPQEKEARIRELEKRYEDWRPVSEPPHEVQIERGALLNFFRDDENGTYWNGTWSQRRDADIWCLVVTAALNERACACLAKKTFAAQKEA